MGRRVGPRGVVVVAHSSAMNSSSALRSIPPATARDGKDPRDTPYGRGVLTTLQRDPFHDSASVSWLPRPAKSPTAMQLDGPVQETPRSSFSVDPGLGVLTR